MTEKERRNLLELQIEKYVVLVIHAYYMSVFSNECKLQDSREP
jgi:hypothetical protein